jgi:hypothetical protein
MTSQPFGILTSIVEKTCKKMEAGGIRCQIVVFANFRNEVDDFSNRLNVCLDLKGLLGEVITVVGTQLKEQKMHHAGLFLDDAPGRPPPVDNGSFDAVLSLTTGGS